MKISRTLMAVLLCTSAAGAADLPLAATLTAGPMSRVELVNHGDQPVTAWTMVIVTPVQDGRSQRLVETIDAYLDEVTGGIPDAPEKTKRIQPHQSRHIDVDAVPAGSTVEIAALVLQDGTALGDAATLDEIFARRVQERDDLRVVSSTLSTVLSGARGIEALNQLKQRFAAGAAAGESTPHRAAREAVDLYTSRATEANADAIDGLLRKYADIVQSQYELADRHSKRKTP